MYLHVFFKTLYRETGDLKQRKKKTIICQGIIIVIGLQKNVFRVKLKLY